MAQDSRVIELEGVHNFRDYGGYAVRGGGRLRRDILWRSGQHHGASEADLARIAALDLHVVFDLRFDAERRSHPCRRPPGFSGKVIFIDEVSGEEKDDWSGGATLAPHVAAALAARGHDAAAMRTMMAHIYSTLPFRPTLVAAMRRYFAELAQAGSPTLIHCLAGKDRTGVAVAMLQRAVGVHRDDVMDDYLLTNTAGDGEARIAAGARALRDRAGALDPEAMRVLMSVEAEYLDIALAAIEARHGSEDVYLAEALGADAALRERLCETLLV